MPTPTLRSQDCLATLDLDRHDASSLVPQRVLLIEGQPDDALTMQDWIEATGRFDVTVATDYPRSDDLLLAEDWALIIIDVHEPAIEDVELVRRAQATRGWTPVLLIVARDRDDMLGQSLRASADAVLTGSITAVGLIGELVRLVQGPAAVAERRALERSLAQRRLAAAVEPLAAGIAHEINNKLAPAVGFADLMMTQLSAPGDQRLVDYCTAVRDSAEAAAGIIRQLLTVSKPAPAVRDTCDLRSVVRDALRTLRARFAESGVQLAIDLPSEPVLVRADGTQLKQVVISLVDNAFAAMEESPARTLDIRLGVEHRDAVLAVRDSGHGIDALTLAHIFEPFFTTRGRSGMGLALSYAVARQHQGELTAESETGEGACFRLRLPLEHAVVEALPVTMRHTVTVSADRVAAEPVAHAVAAAGLATMEPAGETLARDSRVLVRVLLIDDDPSLSALVVEMLRRREGWQVDVACDGLEAVRAIEADRYDLVICDMLLPEITGRQLRDWVAARHPHLVPRLLFMTGDPSMDALHEVERQGAHWLEKPFSSRALYRACDRVLADVAVH